MSGLPFTILIVDDSAVIRETLRSCLERNRDWKVCGEADNGKVAVERVKELSPDAVILDWQMPIMNGIEAAREIAGIAPGTTVVMFTMYCYPNLSQDAKAAGVRHVFSKSEGPYPMVASLNSLCE